MAYKQQQAPGNLELDGLRKFTQEQLLAVARATTAMDDGATALKTRIAALESTVAGHTTSIGKLENNQFARVYLGAKQTGIALSSFVLVNLDTVSFDPSGIWDNTNKRFKPTVAGYYRVTGSASLNWTGAGNQLLVALFKNGAVAIYGTNMNPNGTFGMANGTDIIHFNGTSDYVDLRVYCSGGASRNIDGQSHLTYMHISLVKAD